MESKYNIDNFERFLRDKTDDFKMYPSKRVWYSIYNNMHPGNRMPSVSMCIVLICSLLLVGYLNTGSNKAASTLLAGTQSANNSSVNAVNIKSTTAVIGSLNSNLSLSQQQADRNINNSTHTYNNTASAKHTAINNTHQLQIAATGNRIYATGTNASSNYNGNSNPRSYAPGTVAADITNNNTDNLIGAQTKSIVNTASDIEPVALTSTENSFNNSTVASEENITTQTVNTEKVLVASSPEEAIATNNSNSNTLPASSADVNAANTPDENTVSNNQEATGKTTANNLTAAANKAWIENYALYNRPLPKKWAGKLSRQAYITPSVVYRKLYNNTATKDMSGNGTGNFNNSNVDNAVTQKPSFGLEAGLSYQYDLLKVLKLKAGLQLNYTRYNAHAYENHHPIATSITLNSEDNFTAYEVFRTTPYSNNIGLNPIKLHNETYQFSVPVGADLRLFSAGNISWYAGATIQPTFIIYGNTYLISSDRRNYISDKSMLNRFNLNAGFETYLSFKTSGYTWQIGPQFRSQIFSTNNKVYSVEERLMNYGFKVGITKKL